MPTWAVFVLLMVSLSTLVSCGANPAAASGRATVGSTASPATVTETSSPTPRPSPTVPPTLTPTLTPLPTVPAAATSHPPQRTATSTATETATSTFTPSPTLTPSPTAMPTNTPTPPSPTPSPQFSPTPVPTSVLTQEIIHILLIGGDNNYTLDVNTDTLIVVVVNRNTKQVSMLSIPRDLWVHIPTYGWGRINTAHRIGDRFEYPGKGPALLARTIEENLGIPIDHWVRVKYNGFVRVVDELGGVEVTVPCPVNLSYKPNDPAYMILQPGVHQLDGQTALRYVRTRTGDSDYERAGRQQQFLRAVWDQFKSPEIILKIPGLWSALKGNFQTDLSLGDVLALAPVALDLEPHRVRSRYIGRNQVQSWTTPEGWQVLVPDPERVQRVVDSLYAPLSTADLVAGEAARIQVRNGTSRPYLGRIAAEQLRWEGFQIVDAAPADRDDYSRTKIIVLNDKPEAVALLSRLLAVKPQNIIRQPDAGWSADAVQTDLQVILGKDYDPCR